MGAVKTIGDEFYQSNEEASFPSLVELHLFDFPNLEEWFGDQRPTSTSNFSRLETLKIFHCPKLYTTPTRFPSLKNLDFSIEVRSRPNLKSLPLKLLRRVLHTLVVRNCTKFVGFLPDNEEQQQLVSFLPDNEEQQQQLVIFGPDNEEQEQHYQPDDFSNNFLSKIGIYDCSLLTKLPADFRGLNSLTYLAIKGCRSLKSFPDIKFLPALETLIIEDCTSLKSLPDGGIQCLPALQTLLIEGCSGLQPLPDGIQYLPSLETLIIGGFSDDLEYIPFPSATGSDGEPYFVSLRELEIHGWADLGDVLPGQIQHITSLQRLKIDWYDLLSLPEWFGKLSSLQTLDIEDCENLKCLPSEEQMQRITSLKTLTISGCPLLQERCRPGNEESLKLADFNLTKDGTGGSKYERMGDTTSRKSRKGKEKV
ncbi:hypothetical protein MKX03_014985 [Papaver bracteatum]|nr:hypothetical protein MKX03_014985 [Papaver bracteatum]